MRAALAALVLAAVALAPGSAAGAQDEAPRVLVVSLPHLTWERLNADGVDTPHLDAFFEEAALGALSTRVTVRATAPGTGYATIGAGTRAVGGVKAGLALGRDEPFEGDRASVVYERRMAHGTDAEVLVLSMQEFLGRNGDLHYDAEMGALGRALDRAGIHRAVVANADRPVEDGGEMERAREAAAALMDHEGRVPGGRVDRGLLAGDPHAPFGVRLDEDAVVAAFEREWRRGDQGVVALVEASDLVRADAYVSLVREPEKEAVRDRAIEDADRLFGRLLESVDPSRDAVVVVGPATPRSQARLTVAALRAPGVEPRLLYSSTTRRPGFLTVYDVGAGIAELAGIEPPESMEGRPFDVGGSGGDAASRRAELEDEAREAQFRDGTIGIMLALYVALQLLLAFVAVVVLRGGEVAAVTLVRSERVLAALRAGAAAAALVLLGVLPATYLAGTVDFHDLGLATWFVSVFAAGGIIGLLGWLLARREPIATVTWLLAAILGVIVGNVVLFDSALQFSTVFGDSPIVAGRFTGINNLTYAQLVPAAILLAVLLAHRLGGRRGVSAAVALLAFVLVVDGLPAWGADVGGALSLVATFGYVAYRLVGRRVRFRTVVLFGVVTLAVVGLFLAFDLSRPSDERSHLARLFEQVEGQGAGAFFTVVTRKALANFSVIATSVWMYMVPPALAFVVWVLWRRPRLVKVIEERIPTIAVALGGLLVGGLLGFAVNDSGIAVPGMMLAVLTPVLVHLSLRMAPPRP